MKIHIAFKKLTTYLSENPWKLVFLLVFIFSIALRVIDFGDSLIIKSDQARDLLIMKNLKYGSFSDIPLLGPQVGGTDLRLGPISYYFQYFSGKLFGFSAESIAYPDLFFGIMTVPVLFLLFRIFFGKYLSLWLSALAGVSLLLITFSRFAWNPNSLPFFTALFIVTFITAMGSKGSKRFFYLGSAAVCVGVIAQLHLAAIVGLIAGLVIFLIFNKVFAWRELVLFFLIAATINMPVFINEWKTGWENTKEFSQALSKKESKESGHVIHEKLFRAYQEGSRVFWLTITGQQNTDLILTRNYSLKCDKKCVSALPYSLASMATFGCALIVFYFAWRRENNSSKKRNVFLIGAWLLGFFMFSIFIAYQLETRFYLGVAVLFMVVFGFLAEKILELARNKQKKILVLILGVVLLAINLHATIIYLKELKVSRKSAEESGRDLRFGTAPKVTLGQLRDIGRKASFEFNRDFPVIVTGESLYAKSMFYVISAEEGFNGCYIRGNHDVPSYFNNLIIEYADRKDKSNEFGTLAVKFKKTDGLDMQQELPLGCLNY